MNLIKRHQISALTIAVSTILAPSAYAATVSPSIEKISVSSVRQAFRGDVPLSEQPQSIEFISAEKLNDAGVTTFADIFDLTPSISEQNDFGGLWESFAIRGLVGDENIPSGFLINGYSSGRSFSGTRDTSNIDYVEVMKGSGSALYGRSEPGGTINIITKKPQFEEQGYLKVSAGSWQTYRGEGDYTNEITDQLAFRVNGAIEDGEGFRDYHEHKKTVITPSILWLISDQTKLNYELEYVDQSTTFDRGIVAVDGNIDALPIDTFLGEPSDKPTEIDAISHQLTLENQIGEWSLLNGFSYSDSKFLSESSDAELAPSRQVYFTDSETLSRQHSERDFQTKNISARIELSGSINAAGFTHHLLIGVDASKFDFDKLWYRYRPTLEDTRYAINMYKPVYGKTAPEGSLLFNSTEIQHSYGFYIQDQIDITKQWKVQVGGRYDWFDQQIDNHINQSRSESDQSTFSPRVGLVYAYSDDIQYYTSYSEGFRPNSGYDINGDAFEPESTTSFEAGVKFSTDSLNGSFTVFSAEKSNMLTTDLQAGISTALGKVTSEGVEFDLHGDITNTTSFNFAYTYTDAKTANDTVNTDWWVKLPKGSPLLGIPKHSANAGLKRDLNDLFDFNASIGIAVQYEGERLGETIDPTYYLPSYTLLNLFANYNVNDDVSIMLNVNNLLGKEYYSNSYSAIWTQPGEPVNYKLGLKYSF
ncbi:TonB-dependent siderophore receptor [Pseudoalteromonas fuliginea]|uniref:TonB-dependent receptor n=1 Tax=Pseudoalteromonas fuliginea TaxID=1872678 RepID=A0ABQ6RDC5_9GAMM|nr:TonB-dependent receptor [Pseudoalteromonas fuliginea]KAA1150505.1 TonB-dependent receptor [Pseudoalteromonas fuliginea]KAA1165244.1 TonB-dependent receptor [Pseudoalteromonas fuliginea]